MSKRKYTGKLTRHAARAALSPKAGQVELGRCLCENRGAKKPIQVLANGTRMQHTKTRRNRFRRIERVRCSGSGTKVAGWDSLNRSERWDRAWGTGKSLGSELGV